MKTHTKRLLAFSVLFCISLNALKAQNVGINTTGAIPSANAILDLNTGNSNNLGLLIPNVTLGPSLSTFSPPILNAATAADIGMMVYNTGGSQAAGYYYWNGTSWVSVSGTGSTITAANSGVSLNGTTVILGNPFGGVASQLTQNTEIPLNGKSLTFSNVGGTGTIGIDLGASTSAIQAMEIGGAANTERIDGLGSAGTVYNQTSGTNTGNLVYANGANGDLWSIPASTSQAILTSSATGVLSWQTGNVFGGAGTNNYLARWTPNGTTLGIGITQDNGTEVGINSAPVGTQRLTVLESNAANTAIYGRNSAGTGTNNGVGIYGVTSQAYTPGLNGYGVAAINTNANGTGLYAAGNNIGINFNFLLAGSGIAMNGTNAGGFAYATAAAGEGFYALGAGANGNGVIAGGNNYAPNVLGVGSGGAFTGASYGVFAINAIGNPSAPVYGFNNVTGKGVYVAYWNGTFYKTIATGAATNSCSVPDLNGNYVCMHASETPEAYFEDYGQGQLVNGKIHIDIDPVFAKNVTINDKHPLRVYIQPEGDCKGVYVTNKTGTGFDVVELNGGTSNTTFQYHIICNMADAKMPGGVISKFADLRFEPAPKDLPVNSLSEATKTKTPAEQVKISYQNPH